MTIVRPVLLALAGFLIAGASACGGRSDLSLTTGTSQDPPPAVGSGGSGQGGSDQGGMGQGGSDQGGSDQGGAEETCTPTPIAVAVDQLGPERVFFHQGYVYWTDHNTGRGRVMRRDIDGGVPEVLATDLTRPRGIAVDANHVYWTDALTGAVDRWSKTDGTIESLAPWQHIPTAIALGNGGVYWANSGQGNGDRIMYWSETSGEAVLIAGGPSPAIHVAVDDSRVWWLSRGPNASAPGALRSKPIDGEVSSYVAPIETPRTLAVDGQRVFVGDADTIRSTFKDSGPFTTLVNDAVTRSMASDGQHLYWTDAQGNVNRISVDGGEVTKLAEFQSTRGIAIGERCIYVAVGSSGQNTNDGSVWKLRR